MMWPLVVVATLLAEHAVLPWLADRLADALVAWRDRGFPGWPRFGTAIVLALASTYHVRRIRRERPKIARIAAGIRARVEADEAAGHRVPRFEYEQAAEWEARLRRSSWAERKYLRQRAALWRWWLR